MALVKYGVLKARVIGHLRDADDDHYQILVQAGDVVHRIAVNVKSAAPNAPSTVLFQSATSLPAELAELLRALDEGYKKLPSRAGGLAQDYVRGGLVKPQKMKPVPPDSPGADNDLKDALETAVLKAIDQEGSTIYAFGEKWGPEPGKRDQYFRFTPGNGIHDIHMNQGNSGKWKRDNGVYQDGAIFIEYPDDKWRAFFFAFQSQTFETDDEGNALSPTKPTAGAKPSRKKKKPKKKKTPRKKGVSRKTK